MQRAQIHFSTLQSPLLLFILFSLRCFSSVVSSLPGRTCIYFDYGKLFGSDGGGGACHRDAAGKMIRGNERFMSRSSAPHHFSSAAREFVPQYTTGANVLFVSAGKLVESCSAVRIWVSRQILRF
jgi:hypothetical protein